MANRPPIMQSQITFLYTNDFEKSAAFYGETLGLTLWLDQGTCRIYEVSSTGYVGICKAGAGEAQIVENPSARMQGNVIFTMVAENSENVDKWYEYLAAKGVQFEKTPAYNERYHIYNCFFRDPNGYLLEIQHFLPRE